MCSQSSTFNASSDDTLAAIERLSVQHSQDLDMGELGPGLGSEALGVQFSRDLLKRCSLITHGEDQPDRFGFLFDQPKGTFTGVPSLAFWPIAENTVATREGSVLPHRFPAARFGSCGDHRPLVVPEGVYFINRFNPKSQFHLSLGINYPNASDTVLADKQHPGGDIFIHGSKVSIGCLAMGDEAIEEIYTIAKDCANKVMVFILPQNKPAPNTELWKQLDSINQQFERTGFFPKVTVDSLGNYQISTEK
jgi:hypothetical protein